MQFELRRGRAGRLLGLAAVAMLMTALAARAGDDKDSKADKPKDVKNDVKKDDRAPSDRPKADRPASEKPKNEKPKAPRAADDLFPDIEEMLKRMGPGLDDGQFKEMRRRMEQMRARMQKQMEQMRKRGGFGGGGLVVPFPAFPGMPNIPFGPGSSGPSVPEARLGAQLRQPSATLVDQLDLPRDQGMVVEEVGPNSPAARAGLKPHDILLEVNGKAVSSKRDAFDKLIEGIEPDRKVEAVVMRKGKKETIKALTLPKAKPAPRRAPGFGGLGGFGGFGGLGAALPNGGGQTMSVVRNGDEFTVRAGNADLTVTVKGKVDDQGARASQVTIESNGEKKTYDSVDKVPAVHADKVETLLRMVDRKVAPDGAVPDDI
jgi:hypothetical protein